MKLTSKRTLATFIACLMLVAMTPWTAMADTIPAPAVTEEQVFYSTPVSIEDLAVLAPEVPDTQEEVPEGATRVSIVWLPDDTTAPESVTAIIVGSGQPEKVILEKANGWKKTVTLAASTIPAAYTLLHVSDYTATAEDGSLVFTVTTGEAETTLPVDEGEVKPAVERSITIGANVTPEQPLQYGDMITLNATLVGYDDVAYTLTWQVDRGSGWETVEGANGTSYSFTLSEENQAWAYRVEAVVTEAAE